MSLDPFSPRLYFSELATELSTSPSIEDSFFITSLHLDGAHQGDSLACETTHNEYLHMPKFDPEWHGPNMVIHMMLISAHEFIND